MKDGSVNIVLIENNKSEARYIQELLSKSKSTKYNLIWRDTLQSGIEEIGKSNIDVVITDLDLTNGNSLVNFKELYQSAKDIPILIYTDFYDEEKVISVIREGAQDCLYKEYVNTHRLVNSVAYAMVRKNIREQLEKQKKEIEKAYSQFKEQTSQLIQTEKMSTIGTMVAGVAHELNNPLMAIYNFIEFCLKITPTEDERYEYLNIAKDASNRCIDIVKNLVTFARIGDDIDLDLSDVNEILDSVLNVISYKILKTGAKIYKKIDTESPSILVNRNTIQQAILNLISNAIDAVETCVTKDIYINIESKADFICISIKDTGCGISPQNLQRIFDPFFTTKSIGEGTGLGLYLSNNIIQNHGGTLTCESNEGIGTEFKVLLPHERTNENKSNN